MTSTAPQTRAANRTTGAELVLPRTAAQQAVLFTRDIGPRAESPLPISEYSSGDCIVGANGTLRVLLTQPNRDSGTCTALRIGSSGSAVLELDFSPIHVTASSVSSVLRHYRVTETIQANLTSSALDPRVVASNVKFLLAGPEVRRMAATMVTINDPVNPKPVSVYAETKNGHILMRSQHNTSGLGPNFTELTFYVQPSSFTLPFILSLSEDEVSKCRAEPNEPTAAVTGDTLRIGPPAPQPDPRDTLRASVVLTNLVIATKQYKETVPNIPYAAA